jgi:formate dehydrogenase iron-sulfur subunit
LLLPLKDRVSEDNPLFCLTQVGRTTAPNKPAGTPLIPDQPLAPGEQYRFHFDMTKCIGCHCCEVACNEQNNNPANLNWRRVGEIEGGVYPFTQRFYLSMGCNHCLEPSCLNGCPVDAYTKDALTGIVKHSADACIGCQYCTWNCQYGVPQYNPERGVVGKCDMCYGRLSEGREPACVNACPEQAIQIEIVNIGAWKQDFVQLGNAPGMPTADNTISTTRITLPENLPTEVQKADYNRVRPEHPHAPLVVMTVLTQLSVGAFVAVWLMELAGRTALLGLGAAAAFGVANLALAASTLHLGRPIHAYRALKMWRRSWLSREVLLFTLFAGSASIYAAALWLGLPGTAVLGGATGLLGIGGITASAYIYLVPARPSWNSKHTLAEFMLAGALLGPLFLAAIAPDNRLLLMASVAGSALQMLNQGAKFLWLTRSDEFELKASARLLSNDLERLFILRFALLVLGGMVLPMLGQAAAGLALALGGELLGRYLFFVSVVPKNMAASFSGRFAA